MVAAALSIVAVCTSCGSPTTLGDIVIGTRRGEQDAVDPTAEIAAGSRIDLASTVAVSGDAGWVVATWTLWEAGGLPHVVHTRLLNTHGKTTLFADLEGNTLATGWREGTITCDFKTGEGESRVGTIRVVP